MTDLRKAAEMALDVLLDPKTRADEVAEAVKVIRQALAHPEQQYVIDCPRCGHCCPEREWVALTDELIYRLVNWAVDKEREACARLFDEVPDDDFYCGSQYAAAIRARGEK